MELIIINNQLIILLKLKFSEVVIKIKLSTESRLAGSNGSYNLYAGRGNRKGLVRGVMT